MNGEKNYKGEPPIDETVVVSATTKTNTVDFLRMMMWLLSKSNHYIFHEEYLSGTLQPKKILSFN